MSNLLGIAIPTFNRSNILLENLNTMLPSILKYDVQVYVSDDSTDQKTLEMMKHFLSTFSNFKYVANNPKLGHDLNCISTLKLALEENDYVWYLNDSSFIEKRSFDMLVENLNANFFSAIMINCKNRVTDVIPKELMDRNEFVKQLAWHATKTGVTIYNSKILNNVLSSNNYKKYLGTNFIQLGLLFELIYSCSLPLLWLKDISLLDNNKKNSNSYWHKDVIKVFAYDWANFCLMLNFISSSQQVCLMRMHTEKTKLFSLTGTCYLRSKDGIKLKDVIEYRKSILLVSRRKFLLLTIVSLIPVNMLKFIKNTKERFI